MTLTELQLVCGRCTQDYTIQHVCDNWNSSMEIPRPAVVVESGALQALAEVDKIMKGEV